MPTLNRKVRYLASLRLEIEKAVGAVTVAREELTVAVNALLSVGDKKVITPGRGVSFEKLRVAQDHARDLQRRLLQA